MCVRVYVCVCVYVQESLMIGEHVGAESEDGDTPVGQGGGLRSTGGDAGAAIGLEIRPAGHGMEALRAGAA